ncbi:MAG: glucose-6-phosphate isomerase [Oscillospiraceae bacterium]|nr:glucose-6-phosphate isomerase [Oscillospiraceae bacterium]
MIETDISNLWGAISFPDLMAMEERLSAAHKTLSEGTGAGNDFLGWYHLPSGTTEKELDEIQKAANRIRRNSKALVVIGIGGSYLGARAAIEFMNGTMHNDTAPVKIYFAGNHLSTRALNEIVTRLENVDFSINIVSKSGSTMETAVAARMFRWLLNRKYGPDGAKERIYVTTDPEKGKLRAMTREEGYTSFPIPANVGGRYSVFTACGLLPMAVAGIDIRSVMAGARQAEKELDLRSMENPAWLYAGARNLLYENGKKIEMLCSYEPNFEYVGRWWQQLFGESEGKDGKGIFPACAQFTTDLHSMGQMIQQGERNMFETVVRFAPDSRELSIEKDWKNMDDLNYLAGKTVSYVEENAFQGVVTAHVDGGVPVILLKCGAMDARTLGYLLYFFQLSCGISAYTLGVNPFNQPGVEAYKKNMMTNLGR